MRARYTKIVAGIIICLFSGFFKSQETGVKNTIDSILKNPVISNSEKIKNLSEYIPYLNYEGDEVNSQKYAHQMVAMAKKQKDNQYGIYAYSTQMVVETEVDKIIKAMDSCQWYIRNSTDPLARSIGYNRIGKRKSAARANEYYLKALKEIEGKKFWDQEREVYHDIIGYYETEKDFVSAIRYSKKNVETARKSGDNQYLCMALVEQASLHWEGYKEKMSDQVLQYCNEALSVYEKHYTEFEYAYYIYTLLMTNFAHAYEANNELDTALLYAGKAYEASVAMGTSDFLIPATLRISSIFKQKNNYVSAEKYVFNSYSLFYDEEEGNDPYTSEITLELASVYSGLGRYKDASDYFRQGISQMETRFRDNNQRIDEHMQVSFQLEKKEKERELLQEQELLNRKRNIIFGVLAGVLLLSTIFTFLFFRNRILISRQEQLMKKNEVEILEKENEKTKIQEELYEEQVKVHKEELELKKREMEDLQKKLLVKGVLADHKSKTLDRLEELLLASPELGIFKKQIERVLKKEDKGGEDMGSSLVNLESIHPDFYNKLQERTGNKLTALDLKYCSCIYMKMSSKEMADVFHVEPRTVRVTKYRLKQKLGLSKEEGLNQFIETLV